MEVDDRLDPFEDLVEALAGETVREDERPVFANDPRIPFHDIETGADMWREVDLVDHEQV